MSMAVIEGRFLLGAIMKTSVKILGVAAFAAAMMAATEARITLPSPQLAQGITAVPMPVFTIPTLPV
jgi:hypothetical protein